MMQGNGLNSIRIRFALMVGVLTVVTVGAIMVLDGTAWPATESGLAKFMLIGVISLIPAAVTYMMAGRLTNLVLQLRKSTEAIAAGDFNAPVDVNCACEIGGLADSFRTMVARLNSNILRMNVLAYSDRVTELPNRAVITHVLNMALRSAGGQQFQGAIMFIDLDRFKQVNDTLGHDAGDELLRQASRRILGEGLQRTPETIDNCMTAFGDLCDRPPRDIVFVRFAGDEFVALLPGVVSRSDLETVANRIIQALCKPFRIGNNDVLIGASVGIACTPGDTRDPAELLNFADLAMYAAKDAGRSCFAFFDGTLRETALQRVNIEKELREGLDRDEIRVHYQPKVHTGTQAISGMEALARWQHPVRGLLMPKDFIDVAEQSGLIGILGCRVAELAMKQAAFWHRAGLNWPVSINVSRLQFLNPDFVSKFCSMLEAAGAPAALIELEITESVALSDLGFTTRNLEHLRAMGVKISIDDFGCGFSNLSQIAKLPFDTLKIDRSLIEGIGADSRAESVICAIVSMGRSLGHGIVAEGVETLKQLAFLESIGCDVVQGFLISRAQPADSLRAWHEARDVSPARTQQAEIEQRFSA